MGLIRSDDIHYKLEEINSTIGKKYRLEHPGKERDWKMTCSLYHLDSYKRDNILLKVYKGESRGGFTDLLHTLFGMGDLHA